MTIIFYDGRELECSEVYFASVDELIVDGEIRVNTVEVSMIERS